MAAKSKIPSLPIPLETIERRICLIRGQKVIFDFDLAGLYQVGTKALNQAVKRNASRFPEDFMFQLNGQEFKNWRSQIVTSNPGAYMGLRRPPYVFAEHGVAMLSSVLNSPRAIQMNIFIIRAFVKLRELLASHQDLAKKMRDLEQQQKRQGVKIDVIYKIVEKLISPSAKPKNKIGFRDS